MDNGCDRRDKSGTESQLCGPHKTTVSLAVSTPQNKTVGRVPSGGTHGPTPVINCHLKSNGYDQSRRANAFSSISFDNLLTS